MQPSLSGTPVSVRQVDDRAAVVAKTQPRSCLPNLDSPLPQTLERPLFSTAATFVPSKAYECILLLSFLAHVKQKVARTDPDFVLFDCRASTLPIDSKNTLVIQRTVLDSGEADDWACTLRRQPIC